MNTMQASRPTGATVISIVALVEGILLLFLGVLVVAGSGFLGSVLGGAGAEAGVPGIGGFLAGVGIFFGAIVVAVAIAYLFVAYGVWQARGWSWILAAVVYIIALVFGVMGLAGGFSIYNLLVGILLPVLVLYFLWQPDVKRYLGRG